MNGLLDFGKRFGMSLLDGLATMNPDIRQERLRNQEFQSQEMDRQRLRARQDAELQRILAAEQAQRQAAEARNRYLADLSGNMGPPQEMNPAAAMLAGLGAKDVEMLRGPEPKFHTLGKGQNLVRTGPNGAEVVAQGAPDEPKLPSSWQEFQLAMQDPKFAAHLERMNRARGTSVNVTNPAPPLINTMAQGLGKQLDSSLDSARSAANTIDLSQRLQQLLSSDKAITGAFANQRVFLSQLAQTLGVGGESTEEMLTNTREVMQGLAQFELDAAQQMKGQGQITEAERAILRRAAGGEITFTTPELKSLARVLEARASKRIQSHQSNVDRLRSVPGAESLIPFYEVKPPSRKFNPATGRIE